MVPCPLCGRPLAAPTCFPGPGWGEVHHACFVQVDSVSEALERSQPLTLADLPPPALPRLLHPREIVLFGLVSPQQRARALARLQARGIHPASCGTGSAA